MTSRQLDSSYLIRPFPRVYVRRDHEMTGADWIAAANLSMPDRSQLSHVSRIQSLGLDIGDVLPVRFTVSGDLHLAVKGIFLHRTEVLPPLDDIGVTPAAAFIQYCATATMIDAIKVGDWLLHRRHMTSLEVSELARRDDWRPGARQVRAVLPHLDGRSRSVKESEVRARIVFAGLPRPELNVPVAAEGEEIAIVDLLIRCVLLALEYEGRQHAETLQQFNRDIHRYAALRRQSVEYLQVTQEMLDLPKVMVLRVHSRMCELGYDGPAPVFGDRWASLDAPIPRDPRRRR